MTQDEINREEASRNLKWFIDKVYPGRWLMVGMSRDGRYMVQVYGASARDPRNKDRILTTKGGKVIVESSSGAPVARPDIVFYDAMDETAHLWVVTNGQHTHDIITRHNERPGDLMATLFQRDFEDDLPNGTSRIAGTCIRIGKATCFELAMLRKSESSNACDRIAYAYGDMPPGYGRFISTYVGDAKPLPPFRGEPLLMPLGNTIDEVLESYWHDFTRQHRIGIAVKFIPLEWGLGMLSAVKTMNTLTKGQTPAGA